MSKIMVVDDEPDTVEVVKLALEKHGHEIIEAFSGMECLEKLDTRAPDLIILDIMMPEIDGWGVFRKIRENDKKVPIILLTVRTQNIDKMLGIQVLKAADYITKPFGREDLIKRVDKVLKR